jgi:integrase
MASYRTRASGTVEALIRNKSLPGDIYLTFNSIEEAKAYCGPAEALIKSGQIPDGLLKLATPKTSRQETFALTARPVKSLIDDYLSGYHVTEGDKQWLSVLRGEIGETEIGAVTVQWGLDLIRGYKLTKQLTPATIRHRVGALRRCLDWHVTCGGLPMNPLKLLPTRYATYNDAERSAVNDAPPADNARDRRLEPGEEERIRKVLANDPEYLAELGAERGIDPDSQEPMTLLFELAIETAMRMRETFTLTWDQIDIEKRTIFLDKTKNGDSRQVPMSSVVVALLSGKKGKPGDLVFPLFWNGDLSDAGLRKASSRLSGRWRTIARLAKCDDLHWHDLRHHATSLLFERTTLSDIQISRITGHRDPRMLRRYANLRASDLAAMLW